MADIHFAKYRAAFRVALAQANTRPVARENTYEAIVATARRRFTHSPNGARSDTDRKWLALAYYRQAWLHFDKRTRDDEKPPSFPWIVATEELLGAAQVPSPPAQEAVTRLPVKIEIHAVI